MRRLYAGTHRTWTQTSIECLGAHIMTTSLCDYGSDCLTSKSSYAKIPLSWQMNYAGLSCIEPVQFRNPYGSKPSVAGVIPAFICQDAQASTAEGFERM